MICKKCKDIREGKILTDKMLLKEISIFWNNSDDRSKFASMIKRYFGEERYIKIIDTIKRIR